MGLFSGPKMPSRFSSIFTLVLFALCIASGLATTISAPAHAPRRSDPLAGLKAALVTRKSDADRLCPGMSAMNLKLRCLAVRTSELSTACKVSLVTAIAAMRAARTGAPTPSPPTTPASSATTPVPQTSMAQLRTCMPSIAKVCQPQMVERMTRDGLAEKLIGCGKTFLKLCPAETLQIMGSDATGKTNWKAAIALTKCLNDPAKRAKAGQTCDIIEDALAMMEASKQAKADEKTGGGYGWGYGKHGHCHGKHCHSHGDDDDEEGGAAGLIALLCMCCGLIGCGGAAGYSYAKGNHLRQESMRAGVEYQQQSDMELGSPQGISESFAPPGYAVVEAQDQYPQHHGPIAVATPVN